MRWGTKRWKRVAAALAALLVAVALGSASAASSSTPPGGGSSGGDPDPWPALLPPLPVSAKVQPYGVKHCRHASIGCIDNLLRRLYVQWRPLDRSCDHRALFSLAYIRITTGLRAALVHGQIRYPHWLEYVITHFSNHYFKTFRDYAAGRPVPYAWKVTYDEAMHGDANGGQDTLLASNAHTQHDLPYIYADMGMRARDGRSRKVDHDRVNDINDRVFRGLEDYFAAHYDPSFKYFEMTPLEGDKRGVLEMIKMWREGAWRNGERLMNARTPAQRRVVERSIDATSSLWADMIRSGDIPGYRAQRDAYCHAVQAGRTPPSSGPFAMPPPIRVP